jgi:hypothetical protein
MISWLLTLPTARNDSEDVTSGTTINDATVEALGA